MVRSSVSEPVKHGLQNLDQIDYAVLEHSGGLSIVPKRDAEGGA